MFIFPNAGTFFFGIDISMFTGHIEVMICFERCFYTHGYRKIQDKIFWFVVFKNNVFLFLCKSMVALWRWMGKVVGK